MTLAIDEIIYVLERKGIFSIEEIHNFLDRAESKQQLSMSDSEQIYDEFKKILNLTNHAINTNQTSEALRFKVDSKINQFCELTDSNFFRELYNKACAYMVENKNPDSSEFEELMPKSVASQNRDQIIKLINGAWHQKEAVFKLFHAVKQYSLTPPLKQKYFYNFCKILFPELGVDEFQILFFKDYLFVYKESMANKIVVKLQVMQKMEQHPYVLKRRKKTLLPGPTK